MRYSSFVQQIIEFINTEGLNEVKPIMSSNSCVIPMASNSLSTLTTKVILSIKPKNVLTIKLNRMAISITCTLSALLRDHNCRLWRQLATDWDSAEAQLSRLMTNDLELGSQTYNGRVWHDFTDRWSQCRLVFRLDLWSVNRTISRPIDERIASITAFYTPIDWQLRVRFNLRLNPDSSHWMPTISMICLCIPLKGH